MKILKIKNLSKIALQAYSGITIEDGIIKSDEVI